MKTRNGKGVRDMRTVSRGGATLLRGTLCDIVHSSGTVTFIAATDTQENYSVSLSEIVGCDSALLKENDSVEAILFEGFLYGICRTVDLYLDSKLSSSSGSGGVGGRGVGLSVGRGNGNASQRPKLNLTVKKDRGGTIMAQVRVVSLIVAAFHLKLCYDVSLFLFV